MTSTASRRRSARPTQHGVDRSEPLIAYAMLSPVLLGLGVFVLWPLARSAYLSLFRWNFYGENTFIGWKNFTDVLSDPKFLDSVVVGLKLTLMVVPTSLVVAFLFASLAKAVGKRLSSALKIAIYIPSVISGVIASLIFLIIYQYAGGILNWFVGLFGVGAQAWIGNAQLALGAVSIPVIWVGIGLTSLIMLAGMLDVPDSYYEAAQLEGAGWWRQQISITIPLMRNIFLYLLITGFTAAIQVLDIPLVLTNGGPMGATSVPNFFIFNHFRNDMYVGYSIAAAFLLFIVIGTISALVFRMLRSEKAVDA